MQLAYVATASVALRYPSVSLTVHDIRASFKQNGYLPVALAEREWRPVPNTRHHSLLWCKFGLWRNITFQIFIK